jgi:FixJ family two-component response regulator
MQNGRADQNQRGGEWAVFVVDDDLAVLNSLKFALEIEGFPVRIFAAPEDILATGEKLRRGCLVIDYNLPTMNGLALLDRLRDRGISIPAILITSDAGPTLRRQAASAGVAIVEKPLLGGALTDAIGKIARSSERN